MYTVALGGKRRDVFFSIGENAHGGCVRLRRRLPPPHTDGVREAVNEHRELTGNHRYTFRAYHNNH